MFDIFSFDFIILVTLACLLLKPEDFIATMYAIGKAIKGAKSYFQVDDQNVIIIEKSLKSPFRFPYVDGCTSAFAQPL